MLDLSSSRVAMPVLQPELPRLADAPVPPLPPTVLKPADLLTQILLGLRLEGVEYGRCRLRAPWAVAFPARQEARFHFVARGGCWLRTPGSEWVRLNAGDAVLLPRGSLHVLASAPDLPAVDIDSLARRPVADDSTWSARWSRARARPARTSGAGRDVLRRHALQPGPAASAAVDDAGRVRANDLAQRDPSVPALLEAMEREVALDRIGACGILARLADVVAASIIRAWVECACNDASGWIAAVQCPSIGKVIAAIHAEPERNWRGVGSRRRACAWRSRRTDWATTRRPRSAGPSSASSVSRRARCAGRSHAETRPGARASAGRLPLAQLGGEDGMSVLLGPLGERVHVGVGDELVAHALDQLAVDAVQIVGVDALVGGGHRRRPGRELRHQVRDLRLRTLAGTGRGGVSGHG
ncbi:cupin domain-containing protein [Ditylenchus destructor]|nr:cupin domain-containing protein [Ditylenchus destructor]